MTKHWQMARPISEETKKQFSGIHPIVLQLLFNRGITKQDGIGEFLNPDWDAHVHDPFLFKDMEKAIARIFIAMENNERVVIFGDYDADGVCGTAILYTTMQRIGIKHLTYYIPHRETEGYGLNKEALERLAADKAKLVITVDLGVSNAPEIAYAGSLGMDVIVVDHHQFHEENGQAVMPGAHAIIHARVPGNDEYPFKYLCGAGTAFKLAQALLDHSLEEHEAFEKWLLDLVAIATIADVVPLVGENRTFVKYGLMVLNKTKRLGLRSIIETAKLNGKGNGVKSVNNHFNLNSWNIAFQIAPRINAAGRINHANEALSLLLTDNDQEADTMARHLNTVNQERQQIADMMYKQALEQFGEVVDDDYVLIAYNPEWPIGVVGLVAGKLSNKYHRPVILLTDAKDMISGSGRSVPEFDIVKGLERAKEHLDRFGGHATACGLKLKRDQLDVFTNEFKSIASDALCGIKLRPVLNIDTELDLSDINDELVELVELFEPFGEKNPTPLFLTKKAAVKHIDTVGSSDQHLKLTVCNESEQHVCKVIGFQFANGWKDELKEGDKIDIVYELGFNNWNGNMEIQMKLKDLRLTFDH